MTACDSEGRLFTLSPILQELGSGQCGLVVKSMSSGAWAGISALSLLGCVILG